MLSILASFAQEESKSASDNMKWRIRKDFEQGRIGSITIFGYRRNANGVLEIEPSEADIVRMIFSDYISGMGGQAIANKLNEMGIKTAQGNLWTAPRIKELLSNEKYIGNMLLQKYYRNNHIEKKKTRNNGELQQILVEESHEPIIDRETFDMAQRILAERHRQYSHEGATNRYSLSGMIKCGCCGKNYQRKMYSQGAVWMCATYLRRGKKHCSASRQISEKILFQLIGDPAIITPEEFDLVQAEFEKRAKCGKQYSSTSIYASKILCGDCGGYFGAKVWHSNSKYRRVIYQCNSKFKNEHLCTTPHLYEQEIQQKFLQAFSQFFEQRQSVIENCRFVLNQLKKQNSVHDELQEKFYEINEKLKRYIEESVDATESSLDYQALNEQYEETYARLQAEEQAVAERKTRYHRMLNILKILETSESILEAFDENVWNAVLENLTVFHDGRMVFLFRDGTEIDG